MADTDIDIQRRLRGIVSQLPYGAAVMGYNMNKEYTLETVADLLERYGNYMREIAAETERKDHSLQLATRDINSLRRIFGDHDYNAGLPTLTHDEG